MAALAEYSAVQTFRVFTACARQMCITLARLDHNARALTSSLPASVHAAHICRTLPWPCESPPSPAPAAGPGAAPAAASGSPPAPAAGPGAAPAAASGSSSRAALHRRREGEGVVAVDLVVVIGVVL
eukprot:776586-Pyramimonas_sp.AAC.1